MIHCYVQEIPMLEKVILWKKVIMQKYEEKGNSSVLETETDIDGKLEDFYFAFLLCLLQTEKNRICNICNSWICYRHIVTNVLRGHSAHL
jgi:hypothetical protein